MIFAHGGLSLIFLPSVAPICPENAMPALRDWVSPGDHATDARFLTGNSTAIVLTSPDCDDRPLQSRTTIA